MGAWKWNEMKIKFSSSPRSPESDSFYSFSTSLFRFVWYVNEVNYDVKLCSDHCKLLENHVYLQDYWTKVCFVWF